MRNNPKGYSRAPLRANIKPGQGSIREMAAYLLDANNFSGVPATKLAHIESSSFHYTGKDRYPKLGSLQEFVKGAEVLENYSSSMFSVLEVQKIALLDLRLLNCDRNDGNILVQRRGDGTLALIPIDHSYCLPAQLNIDASLDWVWHGFPQVQAPVCPEIVGR
jgi:Phosphatidylinositol 3- and 4-kinase